MKIAPFRIEQYYAVHEFTAPYMLSSSDAESVAIDDLLALEPDALERLLAQRLGYTESVGAPELRAAIAPIYETLSPDDVVVVAAAEEAIFVAYHALLEPGDHVVVETPCYESALQVARSAGAAVTEWRRSASDGWAHDLDALRSALRPDTKLVYINSPHNPTGMQMSREVLDGVVGLCAERGAWLFSDEVYRELEHDPADRLPAACDLYERALSLGSMSKTYGLPGLRLGWLACRDRDALQRIVDLKHYTTICSSAPSELLSALALRHRERARRSQPRHRAREPAAPRRVLRAARRTCSRGCDRLQGRSDSRGCTEWTMRPRSASSWSPPRECSSFPAPSTTSRATSASASAGPPCPRRWNGSSVTSTHVLNPAEATSQPGRKVSEHPADTPWCRQQNSLEKGAAMSDGQRLTTWIEWYRFAREALELGHAEASAYATARYVEEQNRTQSREWRAA